MDPRLGTDTSGPGEAVFAIRFNGKRKQSMKPLKFRIFNRNTGFASNLIAKTASPGPVVSVPTQGSWKFDDFLNYVILIFPVWSLKSVILTLKF